MPIYLLIIIIFLTTLAAIIFLYLIATYKMYKKSCKTKNKNELILKNKNQLSKYNIEWLNNKFEDLKIKSFDKIYLYGHFLRENSNNYLISVHDYKGNYKDLSNICSYFNEQLKYNVLMIENRGTGKSNYPITTLGSKESKDIISWIKFIISKNPNANIVLYGFSMGGVACLNSAKFNLPNNVKAIISDSAFSSIRKELNFLLNQNFKNEFLRKLFIQTLNIFTKIFHNFSFDDNYPLKNLKNNKIPTLLIHGQNDSLVPFFMLNEIYNVIPSTTYKLKISLQNTKHGMTYFNNPKFYTNTISNFLNFIIK